MRDYYISVAMATYNGEKFIKEQLESILVQLNDKDEVIISDDGSNDNTISIIKSIKDKRIKLLKANHLGVKKNFENAIINTTGKYVFLTDQDDIWLPNKVETVLNSFDDSTNLVMHDAYITDENLKTISDSFYKFRNTKKGLIANIIKNSYIGCCLVVDRSLLNKIIPIPNNVEMHDGWIGVITEKYGHVKFIDGKLIKYRRHSNNTSSFKHYKLSKMLRNRINLIINLIKR